MLKLKFNKNKYEVPDKWEELSQKQFMEILEAIADLFAGKHTLFEFRILTVLIVMGIKPRRIRSVERQNLMSENIYRISAHLPFPLRVEYAAGKTIDRLKKDLRTQLSHFLPDELDPTIPEVRWAQKAKKQVVPNFIFSANLVPEIRLRRKKLRGYKFNLDGKILTTTLSAQQYIEAQTAYNEYADSADRNMLLLLAGILYFPAPYNGETALQNSKLLAKLEPEILDAVFINFQGIQQFITQRTKYSLLFSGRKTKRKGSAMQPGLEAVVFSLIKSGVNAPEEMNLVKFLELMYNDLVSSITSLHNQEVPLDKIAEQTGLTIAKITQVL